MDTPHRFRADVTACWGKQPRGKTHIRNPADYLRYTAHLRSFRPNYSFFFSFNRKLKNPHQEVNYLTTTVAVETTFGTSHQLGVAYVSQLIEAEGAALIPCLGVISQGSSGNELTHLERLFPATVILNNYMKEKLKGPDPGFHQQPFASLEI